MSTGIVRPAERHIPVEFQDIYGIVRGSLSIGQRQVFEEICKLLESLFAQDFMALRRRMKHNFMPFSMGAKGQKLQNRLGKPLPNKLDLDQREINLVADFMQILASARFRLLSGDEWELAEKEAFTFQMPIEVNWSFFDKRLLTEFWSSSTERRRVRMLLPDVMDHCLVFHRGLDVATSTGLFLNEKVDLLLSYVAVQPLSKCWKWLTGAYARLLRRQPAETKESKPCYASTDCTNVHRHAKTVQRMSLRMQKPTVWSLLLSLPYKLTIQEPELKEVVVMYRTREQRKNQAKVKVRARAQADRMRDILSRRNIHVRCFHDIAIADLDLVFPDKKVSLKALSLVTLVVSTITALIAAALMMFNAQGHIDLSVVWSVLSLVMARGFQVYSSMQAERSQTIQDMTDVLYDKTNDAQEGVISMLLEDMAEQQLKEAVMAYTILFMYGTEERGGGATVLEGGNGATEEELDKECEDFLEEHFGLKRDFALEDALPRLVEWGLVTTKHSVAKGQEYVAVSLDEAHQRLAERWARAYECIGQPRQDKELPLTSLFANPNVVLPALPARSALLPAGQRATAAQVSPHSQSSGSEDGRGEGSPAPGLLGTIQEKGPYVEGSGKQGMRRKLSKLFKRKPKAAQEV